MSVPLKVVFSVSGSCSSDFLVKNRQKVDSRVCGLKLKESNSKQFWGKKALDFSDQKGLGNLGTKSPKSEPLYALASVSFGKSAKWWEKSLQPNMVEINSAQDLVHHLLNAVDRLVVVDFYSPGCGGCKALHPKICQIAESNQNVTFLTVNYEQHKEMCYALHVHVLPFFRFYRGAEGKVCSFSCTNATIKKFRDALAKYGTERCGLGPAKGLTEKEMLALASIGQIPLEMVPKVEDEEDVRKESVIVGRNETSSKSNAMAMATS